MAFPTKSSYIAKYGEEEGLKRWEILALKKRYTKETSIAKYGEEEGLKRWEIYCNKHRVKQTLAGYIASGKTEEQWRENCNNRAQTKENMIRRWGEEEGLKRWEIYKKKQAKAGNTLDYFIETYGTENGTARYLEVNSKKGITLENMIRVHGEEEGKIRHANWLYATRGNYTSNFQKEIIKEIINIIPNECMFHDGIFGKEYCLYSDRAYLYDFVITHPIKFCIEINGDYWHANPKLYKENQHVQIRGSGFILARDIWEKDRKKKFLLEQRGYKIHEIWESEWNTNKNLVLQQVQLLLETEFQKLKN